MKASLLILFFTSWLGFAGATWAETPKVSPAPAKQGDFTGRVVIIKVGTEDLMTPARFEFMSRTMKRATEEGAEAVIFDLDTPGGLAWDTTTLMMEDMQKLGPRSIAFVNPRALSAGAMISVASNVIYMSPVSSIGAATPISGGEVKFDDAERAKMNSAMMAMARTSAKAKGHNPAVIEAMIDKDVGLKIGTEEICAKGRILTLDQEQAMKLYNGKPLLAKGIVKDLAELRQREGLKGATVIAEPRGFEYVAILITQYASVLLLIGIAGGYMEMQHPGMTLPGVVAAIAFGLFFFGHFVAGGLAGYETVVIFGLGLALIAVEFFLFPGHIIPGVAGLLMVFGALIYTMSSWDVTVPSGGIWANDLSSYAKPIMNLALALIGAVALIVLLMRFFPSTGPFQRLVLQSCVGGAQASIQGEAQSLATQISVGDTGITKSALRPYGNVDFNGLHMEAMIEGDYIPPQTSVRVVSISAGKVNVERA